MATGRMEFRADTIMQHSNFCFVLPNDVAMEEVKDPRYFDREPVNLILLHGLTGTDTDWLYGGIAQEMAIQYNLNIFMPTTGNSFYLNKGYKGSNYADFIAVELPAYICKTFGIEMKRNNTMIGGLSMGGFGSIHTALQYPERFFACVALSSALVIYDIAEESDKDISGVLPAEMRRDLFGDPEKLIMSETDPEMLYRKNKSEGKENPLLYFAVGTGDALLDSNRRFRDFLKEENADFCYEEGIGKHNWEFWNKYLNRGLGTVLK